MAHFFSFFIKTYMKSNESLIAHGTDSKGKGLEVSTQPKLAAWFLSFLGLTMENSKYPSVPSLISLEKSPTFWSESPPSIQVQRTHRTSSASLSRLHISRRWPENQDRSWAKHRICDGSRTKMVFHIFPWTYKMEGVVFLIRSLSLPTSYDFIFLLFFFQFSRKGALNFTARSSWHFALRPAVAWRPPSLYINVGIRMKGTRSRDTESPSRHSPRSSLKRFAPENPHDFPVLLAKDGNGFWVSWAFWGYCVGGFCTSGSL